MTSVCTLRVRDIRSRNPRGFGGCIFTGVQIDDDGTVLDAREYYVVKASYRVMGGVRIQAGQWWRVVGELSANVITVNGYRVTEWQIEAQALSLMWPSGEHIITLMAESPDFQGIGRVKATRLWETFGEGLYDILDRGDAAALTSVLTDESAQQVVAAWHLHGDTKTLQWLHARGFSVTVGRKVVSYFGKDAPEKIDEDPYRLLSFCASWSHVDALARGEFGIDEQDPRRLQGAVEEALYRLFDAGHTCARISMLADRLKAILRVPGGGWTWERLAADVLTAGFSNGSYVIGTDHDIHPVGPLVMESTVARAVATRLQQVSEAQLLTSRDVDACVEAYQRKEGIELNAEQRLAIQTAAANAFAVITGGAGVGKTTVLKGLYRIFDAAGVRVFQMALAGRAAKRMQEATGRPASTIAGFLHNATAEDLEGPAVVVVDEASMCDIITMYRLCELLPPHVRLVLVGDPNQLMPVGPGLVLHALAKTSGIPAVELTVVKRYGGRIAEAAHAVRSGVFPELSADASAPIVFIPCARLGAGYSEGASEIAQAVLQLYAQAPEKTQILSARRTGAGGVLELNTLCQARMAGGAQPLMVWSEPHQAMARTGFRLGDLLLCTRNLWEYGLQNGSLGQLVQIEDLPRLLVREDGEPIGHAIAWALWDDGERRPLFEPMLDDLELGYAITVHKAQGSQWPRVIVAVTGHRLLDRTLIYTAITRAQEQVILVGDSEALRRAIEALPRSQERHVALGSLLRTSLEDLF
ncbi:MAG: DUF853 family protein [Proteobacteria bacterium]|nr:DUF853 family protein [Pseudomonadota bacterium]